MSALAKLARDLYHHVGEPGYYHCHPTWEQLGDVTKGVWLERAKLKLAGNPRWWSIDPTPQAARLHAAIQTGLRLMSNKEDLNHADVADTLDEISVLFSKLSASFRGGPAQKVGRGADGAAAKPVRNAKPAAKSKPAEEDELTIDAVREKLKELVEAKGKDKMVEALESVGAGKLADVDESQYQELVDKAQEMIDEEDEPAPAKKPATKKTSKKAAGPTLDEVNEAAKALIAADKPAYLKLTKKLGKPSEMDEGDYAAAIEAYTEAMPAEEGEDDLL